MVLILSPRIYEFLRRLLHGGEIACCGQRESRRSAFPGDCGGFRHALGLAAARNIAVRTRGVFTHRHVAAEITTRGKVDISRVARLLGPSSRSRHTSVVADNTLTIKQKSILPVSKTRQENHYFAHYQILICHPQTRQLCPTSAEGASGFCQTMPPSGRQLMSIGASEHRAFVRAKARFACQKAQEHSFVRRNAVFAGHIAMYRWRHFLAESAVCALPFPKSQRPTRPFSSTPGGTPPARPSAASAAARCEPFSAFPLPPGLSACPAWPSAASAYARCEPFSLNRLTPASRNSGT